MKLSEILYMLGIPLIIVESMSFYGYIILSVDEHTIVETHPASFVDMRLDNPWSELEGFAELYDLEELDDIDLAHVPYIVLLLKYLKLWNNTHNGNSPQNSADKREFKALLSSNERGKGCENFTEAISSVWRLFSSSTVPKGILSILEDPKANNLDKNSDDFWIFVSALKEFISLPSSKNSLPVTGVLPDMISDTSGFVKMQQIYREKAKKDFEQFKEIMQTILKKTKSSFNISDQKIETFCKNSRNLKLIRGSPLSSIYRSRSGLNIGLYHSLFSL